MPKHSILVTGDYTIDHHLYEGQRHRYGDRAGDGVREITQLGGAALEHDLLKALYTDERTALKEKGEEPDWEVYQDVLLATDAPVSGGVSTPHANAYALWAPHPPSAPRHAQTWHAKEPLGFGDADPFDIHTRTWRVTSHLPAAPSVVAISDGGMGFRDSPERWPTNQIERAGVVVLNTTARVAPGKLWEHLAAHVADRLIVILSVRDLRQSAALIRAGLSWEESAEGVLRALKSVGSFQHLTRCRHLVVTFDCEGALWLDLSGPSAGLQADTRAELVYLAASAEGEHAVATLGESPGFLSGMTAAIAWALRHSEPRPAGSSRSSLAVDLVSALDAGLCAARDLREQGHGPVNEKPAGFPASRLAKALAKPAWVYSRASFVVASALADGWSLVEQANSHSASGYITYDLAQLVLERGPIALGSVPHVRVGKYITADRYEVESFRVLVQVVRQYRLKGEGDHPLSIGIFGPPGAGKSFAVRELAKDLGKDVQWMEFNLSQFASPADLIGAFHQIRDQVLQQKLPVAFFDEFDSQNYYWLKYLLAPMQDGHFQDGRLTHTLGKSILVMAGGTSVTFARFGADERQRGADAERAWQLAKGPDFKSRLDAYLDVVGPNPRNAQDVLFPVRRALMIRSSLKCDENQRLAGDPGLTRALLHVETYENGSRSLTKLVQSLANEQRNRLQRSLLMPMSQLAMHTDARRFVELCERGVLSELSPTDSLTEEQVGRIAPAINETYKQRFGGQEWANLSEFLKESNRAAARRMIYLLAMVHLRLGPLAETDLVAERAVRDHIEYNLELLAKSEHDGWFDWHVAQGWRWGPKKDAALRLHPDLRPYSELSIGEAGKDRTQVRAFPDFARAANMRIVFRASD